jgi:tRNA dimethylallyltransferase
VNKNYLIVIIGPTAVGKTSIAIQIAKHLTIKILSADSRQFYREMSIGTAKPNDSELSEIEHFFINNLSIKDTYSVGDFERDVLQFLEKHYKETNLAILVGGSGLYVDAVVNGLDELPIVPNELRLQIMDEINTSGLEPLLIELKEKDPVYFEVLDKGNKQRLCRAIEVIRFTGLPFSSFLNKGSKDRPFEIIKIGINTEREILYNRINTRVDVMMKQGLLEEAKNLYEFRNTYALQTVGYKEIFDFMDGKQSLEEAVELIKRNSRRYAKRQLTWFNRDKETKWFGNNESDAILTYIKERIS